MNLINEINQLICSRIARAKSRLVFGDWVMCSKMFVETVKDNLFENLTTNREERYWSVVSN